MNSHRNDYDCIVDWKTMSHRFQIVISQFHRNLVQNRCIRVIWSRPWPKPWTLPGELRSSSDGNDKWCGPAAPWGDVKHQRWHEESGFEKGEMPRAATFWTKLFGQDKTTGWTVTNHIFKMYLLFFSYDSCIMRWWNNISGFEVTETIRQNKTSQYLTSS